MFNLSFILRVIVLRNHFLHFVKNKTCYFFVYLSAARYVFLVEFRTPKYLRYTLGGHFYLVKIGKFIIVL